MKTKKLLNRTLVAACIVLLFNSCSKERIEKVDELFTYEPMTEYFDTKKQPEQEFEITEDGTGPILANQGTKIWADKSNLMFPNGDSVQYPYTVKVIELYTPKDMIYYQMPNMSGNSLFSCKGEVRVRAFKDGEELVLRPSKTWSIEMPDSQAELNYSIFYENNASTTTTWSPSTEIIDTTSYGYHLNITKLGWVATGKFPSSVGQNQITFSSETDDLNTVNIYIYLPEKESLIQVSNLKSIELQATDNVKILIMAQNKDGEFFYYDKESAVGNAMSNDVIMNEITEPNLTSKLNNL